MPTEPETKRAVSFFDGQNLYRHAKDAFCHHHPNYHPFRLAEAVCAERGWSNRGVRFYTGVPTAHASPMWHGYWTMPRHAIGGIWRDDSLTLKDSDNVIWRSLQHVRHVDGRQV